MHARARVHDTARRAVGALITAIFLALLSLEGTPVTGEVHYVKTPKQKRMHRFYTGQE